MVLIYLAHSVVGERILLVVLLIPYAALPYQSVGTTQPPVAILRLEDGMQAVALARKGKFVKRHIFIIGMGGETGKTIVGAYPHVLPLVHETSPHDIVGDGGSITRVVYIVFEYIVDRQAIESVVSTDIELALVVLSQALHRVAIEFLYLREMAELQVGTIQGSLRTDPITLTLGIVSQGIDERLLPLAQRNQALVQAKTGDGTCQQSLRCMQQGIDIAAQGRLFVAHIQHSLFLQ